MHTYYENASHITDVQVNTYEQNHQTFQLQNSFALRSLIIPVSLWRQETQNPRGPDRSASLGHIFHDSNDP